MRSVPTIDLSAYRADEFEADHFETLALACKDMGFFLLKGHGASTVQRKPKGEGSVGGIGGKDVCNCP